MNWWDQESITAAPNMDAAVLRNIARCACIHLCCAPGPVVMANGAFLMIHKGYDSPDKLAVDLPAACTVVDLYAGKTWATKAKQFDLVGKGCRTFLLRLKDR